MAKSNELRGEIGNLLRQLQAKVRRYVHLCEKEKVDPDLEGIKVWVNSLPTPQALPSFPIQTPVTKRIPPIHDNAVHVRVRGLDFHKPDHVDSLYFVRVHGHWIYLQDMNGKRHKFNRNTGRAPVDGQILASDLRVLKKRISGPEELPDLELSAEDQSRLDQAVVQAEQDLSTGKKP